MPLQTSPGRKSFRAFPAAQCSPQLLLLPDHLLKRILQESGSAAMLRLVCKAFSVAVAKMTSRVTLPRKVIGTFPDAYQVVLNFSADVQEASSHETSVGSYMPDDADLLIGALDALAKLHHPLTSLAVLNLSSPLPPPSATTLAYPAPCGLVELQLQDVSIQRAASDGATNLLRAVPLTLPGHLRGAILADSIRTRGAAMVQFARSLPSLRRLSLCNAAFSTSDVAALSALTGLEELSLVGAMECSATLAPACPEADQSQANAQRTKQLEAAVAASVYKQLLAALPRLRSLHLPMPIAAQLRCSALQMSTFFDSDDDDDTSVPDENLGTTYPGGQGDYWDVVGSSGTVRSCEGSSRNCPPLNSFVTGGLALDSGCDGRWSFPPHLEELTIPLCSLNGAVFRAACEVYGGTDDTYGGGGGWGPRLAHRRLRALHITCAPGYTVWEGSFLNAEGDFAALARLAPSLESLHLCLELGASGRNALRRDRLRGCLRHLKALNKIKDLCITETQQPTCFATRKSAGGRLEILSYMLEGQYKAAWPCDDVQLPPLLLGDLAFSSRPWSGGLPFALRSTPPPHTPAPYTPLSWPCASPGRGLDSLLTHWPLLETLSVCGQCAVRSSSGGRIRLVGVGEQDGTEA
ncbi:hypothetical protein VOLCADRAFT_98445 [Volvox carteri f. nagariensis]|uniref:F-box domain-containing protein n=1 Tax=Volvox carteri f. nagariensis TaxID=3068 RepID=D8UFC8_VOLCA|nr:uncharacterized protein VOLCADRAFT_98445 [Volvox carteri f. nagariensis]EFJ41585.1 hypothetical protein VOLCADRAFT_98445 [Volvox carteri f. nagariensis]|eukprot:XP_002957376.1 hypothetical protein VOLCADRAFT_98445 [Volvox carteri f. nagariensis]